MKKSVALILAAITVLALLALAVGARKHKANPPLLGLLPVAARDGILVPLIKTPPRGYCGTMLEQLFEERAAYLTLLPWGESCSEVALVDSGWWPTADPYSIWMLWNADKGAKLPPRSSPLGPFTFVAKGVSGKTVTSNGSLAVMPGLSIQTTKGALNIQPSAQKIKLANGTTVTTSQAVIGIGPLSGTGNTSVGGAFPRALLTYDLLVGYGTVLSYNSSLMGLYPLQDGASAAYSKAKAHFPHLGPLMLEPVSGTTWGLYLHLTLKVGNSTVVGRFVVDTGAVGITLMVTPAFATKLGCYSPTLVDQTTGVSGPTCSAMRRACVADSAGVEVCIPVDVEGSVPGCPDCAGRIGTALLRHMDVFLARTAAHLGSAYRFVTPAAALKQLECTLIQGQCPPPCKKGNATCVGPTTTDIASICPSVTKCS